MELLAAGEKRSVRTLTEIDLFLDCGDVLEGQGIAVDRARAGIRASAQAVLETMPELLEPAVVYDVVPRVDFHHQTLEPEDGDVFGGPLATRALAGAEKVTVAVCMIGPALEERMS